MKMLRMRVKVEVESGDFFLVKSDGDLFDLVFTDSNRNPITLGGVSRRQLHQLASQVHQALAKVPETAIKQIFNEGKEN